MPIVPWKEGRKENKKVWNSEKVVESMDQRLWGGWRTDGIGVLERILKKEHGGAQRVGCKKLWLEESCIIATNNSELQFKLK